jgi:hypothetical protein
VSNSVGARAHPGKVRVHRSQSDHIKFAGTAAMEIRVMNSNLELTPNPTVHQRYRQLLRAGFTTHESASLIALADGIGRHAEGEPPAASTWRWQEISRLEFMGFLARSGQLGGPDDGAAVMTRIHGDATGSS